VRVAGVRPSGETIRSRIEVRVRAMLATGWLDEVRKLIDAGFGNWLTATQAIGYAELARHLGGELALEVAVERIARRTRALARRQMAWFRRDPRIHWFDVGEDGAADAADDLAAYLGAA
jgi:tRNA dimethylallyltransferase